MSMVFGALACPTGTPEAIALAGTAPVPVLCWERYTPKPTAPANSSTTNTPMIIDVDGPRRAVTTDRGRPPVFLAIIGRSPLLAPSLLAPSAPCRRANDQPQAARPATWPAAPRVRAARRPWSAPSR